MTVLPENKVGKLPSHDGVLKEGSWCTVREGRVTHTHGKVAALGKHVIISCVWLQRSLHVCIRTYMYSIHITLHI